jgi:hypothetical protein
MMMDTTNNVAMPSPKRCRTVLRTGFIVLLQSQWFLPGPGREDPNFRRAGRPVK